MFHVYFCCFLLLLLAVTTAPLRGFNTCIPEKNHPCKLIIASPKGGWYLSPRGHTIPKPPLGGERCHPSERKKETMETKEAKDTSSEKMLFLTPMCVFLRRVVSKKTFFGVTNNLFPRALRSKSHEKKDRKKERKKETKEPKDANPKKGCF